MTFTAKIKKLAKNRGWTLKELHKKLELVYGERAVSYFTLSRLGKEVVSIRPKTLHQICAVLGVSKRALLRDMGENEFGQFATAVETHSDMVHTRLCYSEGAYFERLTSPDNPFQSLRLVLSPGIKTHLTQGNKDYMKRLYVLEGKLTVYAGNKSYRLRKGAFFEFESFSPHQFENNGSFTMRCLVEEYKK